VNANSRTLDLLFETGQIDLRRGPLFDLSPGPAGVPWDRVEGMMLGLAIGDALGNTSESCLPQERRARHGEIRDYLPNRYADGRAVGLPSDDTQLAFWTLDQMLADGGLNPEHLAARLARGRIFGIGSTVRRFLANYGSGIRPWYRCGVKSSGNGALMRIAPMLIPHLRSGTAGLWADTALSAMMTHNDSASIAACLAFVRMLWMLLQAEAAPEPGWWPETYAGVARRLEVDESYRPRGGDFTEYEGTLWQYAAERVSTALRQELPVLDACNSWFSGAYLLETVPSALYILMCHGDDPEQAVLRAVNDTKDNDTIAAIVGAAVGALYGRAGWPQRWIDNLTGRTTEADDGRVFVLLEASRRMWGP